MLLFLKKFVFQDWFGSTWRRGAAVREERMRRREVVDWDKCLEWKVNSPFNAINIVVCPVSVSIPHPGDLNMAAKYFKRKDIFFSLQQAQIYYWIELFLGLDTSFTSLHPNSFFTPSPNWMEKYVTPSEYTASADICFFEMDSQWLYSTVRSKGPTKMLSNHFFLAFSWKNSAFWNLALFEVGIYKRKKWRTKPRSYFFFINFNLW